mgnify:CR=1 FL=1
MLPLIDYKNDNNIAISICNGDRDAISQLLTNMQDDIFFHAKKLAKRTTDYQPNTRVYKSKNFSILLNDEFHESYAWICEYISKTCCK